MFLYDLASEFPKEAKKLGLCLGLQDKDVSVIMADNKDSVQDQVFEIFKR